MNFLPVALKITRRKILLVGGGKVAWQKIEKLRPFTENLFVVAEHVCPEIKTSGIPYAERAYGKSDLKGVSIVYACTDHRQLNREILRDAHARGILVNVVDQPRLCDFISPAIHKMGMMTVAVNSDGRQVMRSIRLRDSISCFLKAQFHSHGKKRSKKIRP